MPFKADKETHDRILKEIYDNKHLGSNFDEWLLEEEVELERPWQYFDTCLLEHEKRPPHYTTEDDTDE